MKTIEEYPDFFIEHSPFGFTLEDDATELNNEIINTNEDIDYEEVEESEDADVTICMV